MKRIILHWSGGAYQPNTKDLKHYHRLIDGNGNIHIGRFPIEQNEKPLKRGQYAAHTYRCNSDSIGVAFCAMFGARDVQDIGNYPIREIQWDAMVRLVADLCEEYQIPVTRETVLSHAEVQPTLGIKQKEKWDITFVPWIKSHDPIEIGDIFRAEVRGLKKPKKRKWKFPWIRVGLFR